MVIPKWLKEWYVICDKQKKCCVLFGRLVSFTWYMYKWYENMRCLDWVGLVHPFHVWIKDMWDLRWC